MSNVTFDDIVTRNADMLKVLEQAKNIANTNMNSLISGEHGTGKEHLALAIHNASKSKDKPFVSVNCLGLTERQLELELLGNISHSGTVFIAEIHEMPENVQWKLVRYLQNEKQGNCARIIGATTRDIKEIVKQGALKQELYTLLGEVQFYLIALEQRKEDISELIDYFIKKFNQEFNKKIDGVSDVVRSYLLNYHWSGNVRELKSTIKTAVALADKGKIWLEDMPLKMSLPNAEINEDANVLATFSLKYAEKQQIVRVLNVCKWNKSKTAKLLGVSRPRLDRKIEEFNLKNPKKI